MTGAYTRLPFSRPATMIPEILLLLVAIFWGTSYGLSKEALLHVSVLGFIAIRFLLTFLVLLPELLRELRRVGLDDALAALPTGAILLSIFIAETYGVANTSATNAAFLISLCVLITPFIEWPVFCQFPGWRMIGLALLSVLGVFLLTANSDFNIALSLGDYCILAAAVLRAVMVIATRRIMAGKAISSLALTCLQSLVVGLGALLLLVLIEDEFSFPLNAEFWWITGYLIIFCTIFAFFAQNYAVRRTSASQASLLMGSEPLFGALFAVIWLGERLAMIQIVGAALLLSATLLASGLLSRR